MPHKQLLLVLFIGSTIALPAQPERSLPPELAFPTEAAEAVLPGEGPLRRSLTPYVKRWQERRSQWAGEVARDQGAVVFFGDSITQGWGPDFKGLFPGLKVANRGLAGDTSRGLLLRLDDVLALNPTAIVMLFGTNDIADGIEPEAIARNLQRMLAIIRRHHPAVPVLLCRVMPSSTEKQRPADRIRKLNDAFWRVVQRDPYVTVLDTWTLLADPTTGDADPTWFRDMIHLNPAGYERWAAALRPVFVSLGLPKS